MILCARSTWRSREQSAKYRSCERFVYLIVKISDNQDFMIIKDGRHIHEGRKGMWAFFPLDCAFQVLIG